MRGGVATRRNSALCHLRRREGQSAWDRMSGPEAIKMVMGTAIGVHHEAIMSESEVHLVGLRRDTMIAEGHRLLLGEGNRPGDRATAEIEVLAHHHQTAIHFQLVLRLT